MHEKMGGRAQGNEPKFERINGKLACVGDYTHTDDRAVYKHPRYRRFYRGNYKGPDGKYQGCKLYTCKQIKRILDLREAMFGYCGEWFDVYDENGKVNLDAINAQKRR